MQVLDVYQVIDIVAQARRPHTAALLSRQHQHAWGEEGGPRGRGGRRRHVQRGLEGLHHREGEGGRHHGLLLQLVELRGGGAGRQTAGHRRQGVGRVPQLGLGGHHEELSQGPAHTLPLGDVDGQHDLLGLGLLALHLIDKICSRPTHLGGEITRAGRAGRAGL